MLLAMLPHMQLTCRWKMAETAATAYRKQRALSACSHPLPRHSLHNARASVWLMATAMLQDRMPILPVAHSYPDHARVQTQTSSTAACPCLQSHPTRTTQA